MAAPYGFGVHGAMPYIGNSYNTYSQKIVQVPVAQPYPVPVVKTVAQPVT